MRRITHWLGEVRYGVIEVLDRLATLDRALRAVNRVRRALGYWPLLMLPRGRVGSHTMCPLARALPDVSTVGEVSIEWRNMSAATVARMVWAGDDGDYRYSHAVPTPEALQVFIGAFDRGAFPFLVRRLQAVPAIDYAD